MAYGESLKEPHFDILINDILDTTITTVSISEVQRHDGYDLNYINWNYWPIVSMRWTEQTKPQVDSSD